MSQITIGTPFVTDKPQWRRLYDGYATFYKMPMNDEIAERVWGWINDPAHSVEALVARTHKGRVIGLAHFRSMPRPLNGSTAGFLDECANRGVLIYEERGDSKPQTTQRMTHR